MSPAPPAGPGRRGALAAAVVGAGLCTVLSGQPAAMALIGLIWMVEGMLLARLRPELSSLAGGPAVLIGALFVAEVIDGSALAWWEHVGGAHGAADGVAALADVAVGSQLACRHQPHR